MPLGADLDVAFPSMKVNSCFDFYIINIGATNAATVTANTACQWRVRKTADATYVALRVAG